MELSYERADARVRAIGGTSADQLGTFVSWLVRQQYSVGYVCIVARHAAAFGRWCEGRGVGLDSLADDDIARYQRNRDRCRSRLADTRRQERQALNVLMRFLREEGICAAAPMFATPVDGVADDFARHLQRDQGIAPITVECYAMTARQLLVWRYGQDTVRLQALRPADVIAFVRHRAERLGAGAATSVRGLQPACRPLQRGRPRRRSLERSRPITRGLRSTAATKAPRWVVVTVPYCSCWPDWACVRARSSGCPLTISTGTTHNFECTARAAERA
jgi:hypothetical protein